MTESKGALLNQGRRIAESSAALLFTNVGNKVTGFLIMVTVAHLLGTERLGLYTVVFAYVSAFGLATDLGLSTVVLRRLSQNEESGRLWLGNTILVRWTIAVLTYLASVGGAAALYGADERTWLIAISSLSFLSVPLSTYSVVFQSRLIQRPALVSLSSRVFLLIAVQWLARHNGTLTQLVACEVIMGTATNVSVWLWSRRLLRPSWKFNWTTVTELVRQGVPLFLTSAFIMLYFRIDVFFLEYYRSHTEIGLYAAAYRLTESLPLIASALSSSIFPVLCQHVYAANEESLTKLVRISLKMMLGAAIPVSVLVTFYSKTVTGFLYGPSFAGSAPLLSVLVCNQILVYTNILMTTLLVARGRNKALMYLTFGMLVWNVGLNFLIIPRYGALGAAWTTLATEFVGTIGCLTLTSTSRLFLQAAGRLALPASTCAVFLAFLAPATFDRSLTSLWPAVAVLVIYPLAIAGLRVFDREEWERLRRLAWQ